MESVPNRQFTAEEVSQWLTSNGFEDFSSAFYDEGIDGESLALLTERALESLVTRVGPRMKILQVVEGMKSSGETICDSSRQSASTLGRMNCGSRDSSRCSSPVSVSSPSDSASTSTSSPGSTRPSRKAWSTPFVLPEQFPPVVQVALTTKSMLPKPVRVKFVQTIYDRVCLFTISPTPDQRRDICRSIITEHPFLEDAEGGYETWYRQIGEKVKNELRNEKCDPIVMARKRKNVGESGQVAKMPLSKQRGVINWQPPAINGEDERSCKAHIAWMQKENRKKQPNTDLVSKKMEVTFSFRRKMINTGKHSLQTISDKYPFLFEEGQLYKETVRLLSDESLAETVKSNLLDLAPRIIKVAARKMLPPEQARLVAECQMCDADENEESRLSNEEKVVAAFSLLPFLLEKATKKNPNPQDYFYKVAADPEQILDEGSPMSPFLIISEVAGGGPVQTAYVAGEKQVLMEADSVISAMSSLMYIYYVCNLEYPKECYNTFLFLQRCVLKLYDRVKVPTKVLLFMNELFQ